MHRGVAVGRRYREKEMYMAKTLLLVESKPESAQLVEE
jgi:hypothetical protein